MFPWRNSIYSQSGRHPTMTEDARKHSDQLKKILEDTREQLRAGTYEVDDPQARALYETSAEVLQGLITAFEHYHEGKETAWRS